MKQTISFDRGWQVVQDHFDLGEQYGIYRDCFDFTVVDAGYPGGCSFQMDEWRSIPTLAHLQLLLSQDPHFAPEMRLYNAAPWWYRLHFSADAEQRAKSASLRFEGVDYFCKVWLNGEYLGEHEGYSTPFSFDVSGMLAEENALYVKVWSPLEFRRVGETPRDSRCILVERNMLKGTYEHGDSLLHRDRNPVGVWRPVRLELTDGPTLSEAPRIDAILQADTGEILVHQKITAHQKCSETVLLRIYDESGLPVNEVRQTVSLLPGSNEIRLRTSVDHPAKWSSWDRGGAHLYRVRITLGSETREARLGFREVELRRSESETCYFLNGERIYIRGMSYFPDAYLSLMHEGRIRRDLQALKACGCNLVRVHVHQEPDIFYDLCDEMGILVMQDTDFNWVHPCEDDWTARMLKIVKDQERMLHNHPSIITWVCMNEPVEVHQPHQGRACPENRFVYHQPGPQVYRLLSELNPSMPLIRGSYCEEDPLSGDTHNYAGSIYGCVNYRDVEWKDEKLNTEFGFDAPPYPESLLKHKQIFDRLDMSAEEIREIDTYQYRYLKHRIEWFRLRKHNPTGGHVQFMMVDCSPGSFYGVYDYGGCAKPGANAFFESNQPIGIFYRYDDGESLWVVNDTPHALENCTLKYAAEDESGNVLASGAVRISVEGDSICRAANVSIDSSRSARLTVRLRLTDGSGRTLAENIYRDPYHHPDHPKGHPQRFSHTWGLRLYK